MYDYSNKIKFACVLLLTLSIFGLITHHSLPITSFAQQPNSLSFNPPNGELKVNEEKVISLKINNSAKISGFDLKFTTSGPISVTGFPPQLTSNPALDPFAIKQVAQSIQGTNSRVSYIFTTSADKLPESVDLFIKIKGAQNGQGKITLEYNNSQILDASGKPLQVTPLNANYGVNTTQSSAGFIDPASLPATQYPANAAVVNIKTKLYGASAPAGMKLNALAVAVGRVGDSKFETQPQEFEIISNGDGSFSGTVAFPNFSDGNKFSIMLKVDKYLLRRICNVDASEQKLGAYFCQTPSLTIRSGEPVSFDFTGISLIPGDLGASDVLLNGYDMSIVRNNMGKNTVEAVGLADLNYDGVVDKKDLEIIHYAAANTRRKGDQ